MGKLKRVWPWLACALVGLNIAASSLKITTFNIRWYGLGGEISGHRGDEYRDPFIKEFLTTKYINTDIFVFQEIIDTARLADLMDGLGHHCVTYNHEQFNHQHLMICLKKTLDIVPVKGDDDYIFPLIENRPFLRPAIYGKVIDRYSKKPLLHLVGLHLKAGPYSTNVRMHQVETLIKRIKEFKNESIPLVIAGDLNSYPTYSTELEKSDLELIGKQLDSIGLSRRTSDYDWTYRSNSSGHSFDHAFVSNRFNSRYVEVWRTCGKSIPNAKRLENLSWYKRFISDHCPVSFRLDLK